MTFPSILFDRSRLDAQMKADPPPFFGDLNLDRVIEAVTDGRDEYNLKPFFYAPLPDLEAIEYRHEVMKDLQDEVLSERIAAFESEMRSMRTCLKQSEVLSHKYQKARWFLDGVDVYCSAVRRLLEDLTALHPKARGFGAFRRYLERYAASEPFVALQAETESLKAGLACVRYRVDIRDGGFTVLEHGELPDYSADVLEALSRFTRGPANVDAIAVADRPRMNRIEEIVLEFVAQLYPDVFGELDRYHTVRRQYLDEVVEAFDREVQFYLAYAEYVKTFEEAGLTVCYPTVTAEKNVYAREDFDMALAGKLIADKVPVVRNEWHLNDEERIFVVSGPNQGGKTTFARTFGQLHYLANLGCRVAASEARLFLFDRIFSHFEKQESVATLLSKLEDDLERISEILRHATPRSIVIVNEIFNSTTSRDASILARNILEKITSLDSLCVCVTFIDELSALNSKTVSMASTVFADNPTIRTYKVVRKPADGLAYAIALAEKHDLTYDRLRRRLHP